MSSEDLKLEITPAKLAFVLALLSFLGVFFTSVKLLLDNGYRITTLEASQTQLIETNDRLTTKVDNLGNSLNQFNVILREIQVRQEKGDK